MRPILYTENDATIWEYLWTDGVVVIVYMFFGFRSMLKISARRPLLMVTFMNILDLLSIFFVFHALVVLNEPQPKPTNGNEMQKYAQKGKDWMEIFLLSENDEWKFSFI